jgi:hypothetical protein
MDATTETIPAVTSEGYKSRPGALIWFFKKSRDNWKRKHQALKASVKGLQNQLAAVTRSRAQWRAKAETADRRVADLEAELAAARGPVAAARPQKRTGAVAR